MLNCFVYAKYTQEKANDKVTASWLVQSDAEMIKSADTLDEAVLFLAKTYGKKAKDGSSDIYTNYYDKDWNHCTEEKQEYTINTVISLDDKEYGEFMDVKITVVKSTPYPFVDMNKMTSPIYSIETSKFFSTNEAGRQ